MTITVGGTSITFNDGTTQTTAAGTPTTAQVLSATAGASVGAVGTYAYAAANSASVYSEGSTIAGSTLRYFGGITSGVGGAAFPINMGYSGGGALSGTWRAMGRAWGGNISCFGGVFGNTLWLRIS